MRGRGEIRGVSRTARPDLPPQGEHCGRGGLALRGSLFILSEPRTVDVHIRRLRKAINGPRERDLIRTVRSAGYALDTQKG